MDNLRNVRFDLKKKQDTVNSYVRTKKKWTKIYCVIILMSLMIWLYAVCYSPLSVDCACDKIEKAIMIM